MSPDDFPDVSDEDFASVEDPDFHAAADHDAGADDANANRQSHA